MASALLGQVSSEDTGIPQIWDDPAVTFRLMIGEVELEGRWLCVGREFVRLGEAAEEI